MIPCKDVKSLAPALDAGLDIIEFLALKKEAGFNELCRLLPMSKASVARILKTLSARGYVRKGDAGDKWVPGPKMGFAGLAIPIAEILRAEAPKILRDFVDETGNTALCVHWDGDAYQCVAKEQREGGIVMMELGSTVRDLSRSPWGWLFFLSLDKEARRKAIESSDAPDLLQSRIDVWARHIEERGFAFDDHEIFPERMRFGAPIRSSSGKTVGALGASGTRISIPPKKLAAFGSSLIDHAGLLSKILQKAGA